MLEVNTPFYLTHPSPIGEGLVSDFFSYFSKVEKTKDNCISNGLENS